MRKHSPEVVARTATTAPACEPISRRRMKELEEADALSPELRECVHEFGFTIVRACLFAGVQKASAIRALVHEIWEGARQPSQTRLKGGMLDWVLLQAGAQISAARLMRVLEDSNLLIIPREPTVQMVEASKATVSGFTERITKTEKHRRRLYEALKAGAQHLRPKLFAGQQAAADKRQSDGS